jgi:hypothetical protein
MYVYTYVSVGGRWLPPRPSVFTVLVSSVDAVVRVELDSHYALLALLPSMLLVSSYEEGTYVQACDLQLLNAGIARQPTYYYVVYVL